ncbi:hypothetical protein C9374_010692 [Naegleria lovaniensis]|uniref:Prolyl endopeptidase-like n=1 Tax=Naegleria lovaniensis TaxID=51637 RepID=A0AA88GFT9_NAELO|nr:uncharacterized protein C9374_010692 [Naegleria lovaniensis]KAG2374408.1 hypothetical protein C9374_010692 [Naegleria lovaniensis]
MKKLVAWGTSTSSRIWHRDVCSWTTFELMHRIQGPQVMKSSFFSLFKKKKKSISEPLLSSEQFADKYKIHNFEINDPYYKLPFNEVALQDYIHQESEYYDQYFTEHKAEVKRVKTQLKDMQKNFKSRNVYRHSDKLLISDVETAGEWILISFNFDEYVARIPKSTVPEDLIFSERFYQDVCETFERQNLSKTSLHSKTLSSTNVNLEVIYNKHGFTVEIEKYVKKHAKKISKDRSVSYKITKEKSSHCLKYTATVVDINDRLFVFVKGEKQLLHVIDDIPNVSNFELSPEPNGLGLLFTTTDEKHRTSKIFHRFYRNYSFDSFEEQLILEEKDDRFFIDIGCTKTNIFKYISINSKNTTEVHLLESDGNGNYTRTCLHRRQNGIQFFFEYHKESDSFFIISNSSENTDLDIYRASGSDVRRASSEVIPKSLIYRHKIGQSIHEIDIFSKYLVVYIIENSLIKLLKYDIANNKFEYLPMVPDTHYIELGANLEYHENRYSVKCHSLLQQDPIKVSYNLDTNTLVNIFNYSCKHGTNDIYNPNLVCECTEIGNNIPIKILYDKTKINSESKCFVVGYGAYGTHLMEDLQVSSNTLYYFYRQYFLERGYIFVFAHVRGGRENGLTWYQQGIKEHKINSMMDLKQVMDYLVNVRHMPRNYGMFIGRGISAGGLLMMSTHLMFEHEQLFKCLVLKVPFLDVLTTMMDDSLPLTEHEFDEYGDPKSQVNLARIMMKYSPYHLLMTSSVKHFPSLLMTASHDDFQCPIWNVAKTMAVIRSKVAGQEPKTHHHLVKVHHLGHADEVFTRTMFDDVAKEIVFIENAFKQE